MAESRELMRVSLRAFAEVIEAGVLAPGPAPERAFDVFVLALHGLTALHMANEPDLPSGSGRFGSLVPEVLALHERAWAPAALDPHPAPSGT
jgi:hypothetical protein